MDKVSIGNLVKELRIETRGLIQFIYNNFPDKRRENYTYNSLIDNSFADQIRNALSRKNEGTELIIKKKIVTREQPAIIAHLPSLKLSDNWTTKIWKDDVIVALEKKTCYDEAKKDDWIEQLSSHGYHGGGVALDIGCAEGTFTNIWIETLKHRLGYPKKIYLIDENEALLNEAVKRLQLNHDDIEFLPIYQSFIDWSKGKSEYFDLVVASHVTYYFDDAIVQSFLNFLEKQVGVAWIVIRDRECGLYRKRFQILAEHKIFDTDAHKFSDYLIHLFRQQSKLFWTTVDHYYHLACKRLRFPLEREKAIFYFLCHLSETDVSSCKLTFDINDWGFAETHLFASPRQDFYDDSNEQTLLTSSYEVLVRHGFTVLDLQLARLNPTNFHPSSHKRDSQAFHTARHIEGSITLWGWRRGVNESKMIQELTKNYFENNPTFLLFDCFYSNARRPIVSEPLKKFNGDPSMLIHVHRNPDDIYLLDQEPTSPHWEENFEYSTFDVALASWFDLVKKGWKTFLKKNVEVDIGGNKLELRCFAVPARLGDIAKTPNLQEEIISTSAGLFGTILYSTDEPDNHYDCLYPQEIYGAYYELSTLLMSYVGQLVYSQISERKKEIESDREKIDRQRIILDNKNEQLEIVKNYAEELASLLKTEVRELTDKIMYSVVGGGCILDAPELRDFFNEDKYFNIKDNLGKNHKIRGEHDPFENNKRKIDLDREAWLGLFIYEFMGCKSDTITYESILPQVKTLISSDLQMQEGRFILRDILLDKSANHLWNLYDENLYHWCARPQIFMKYLILYPWLQNCESTFFSLAVRILMQTDSDNLIIKIIKENNDEVDFSINDMVTDKISSFFYDPKFPSLNKRHSEWFIPVVNLVSKVFKPGLKKYFVNKVIMSNINGLKVISSVTLELSETAQIGGKGTIDGLIDALNEVKRDLANGKDKEYERNFRQEIAKILKIGRLMGDSGAIDVSIDKENKYISIQISS